MGELPLVSIVTPSFNQGRFLEATIRSVLEQDYTPIEYIVIDGGSTDESLSVIQAYAERLSYWVSEADRGQSHAINKGLKQARGKILGWLNSDDVLAADAVSRAVAVFENEPEIDVVYGLLERIDEDGRHVPTPILPKDRVEFSAHLVLGECVVNQPGSFWRRAIMERAGMLDEGLQYAMDYEYWARLALNGARFRHLPQVAAKFRLSANSKTVAHTAEHAGEQLRVLESLSSNPVLGQKTGLSKAEIESRVKRTQAVFLLQAFYGEAKRSHWRKALGWLGAAFHSSPAALLDRRWLDLGLASLRRRSRRKAGK
jgi:glycosyltransferase involved in cell wall biosynthesis